MNLLETQTLIFQTQETINHLLENISKNPESKSLRISLNSLEKRREELEKTFEELAHSSGKSLIKHALLNEKINVPIYIYSEVLKYFQSTFSLIFDAIENGYKRIARVSSRSLEITTLYHGYNFQGSLGTTLMIENENILFESKLQLAMRKMIQILESNSEENFIMISKELGPAILRSIYNLSHQHSSSELGLRLKWDFNNINLSTEIYKEQFSNIVNLLGKMKEEQIEEIFINGILVGIDVNTKSFHAIHQDDNYKGTVSFPLDGKTYEIPGNYGLTIKKISETTFASDKDSVYYYLQEIIE